MHIGGRIVSGPPLSDLFPLGRLLMTPAISYLLSGESVAIALHRHSVGEWANPAEMLSESDQERNEIVLVNRIKGNAVGELLSKYRMVARDKTSVDLCVFTNLCGGSTNTWICLPHER